MGIGGYLVKPLKRADLLDAIGEVLSRKPQGSPTVEGNTESKAGEPAKLLLVEDNPDNRLLIKAYLKKQPFTIDEAENGEQAIALFKENDYDLVLMDVQMPVMDGHEATRVIRSFEAAAATPATPIIALTAHAIKEEHDKSIAAGCTAHLTKPIKKQTLIEAVTGFLS